MKRALVCGAGGFIGGHPSTALRTGLVKKLKKEGYWVRGVDIKEHEFAPTAADEFLLLDLREPENCKAALSLEDGHPSTGLRAGEGPGWRTRVAGRRRGECWGDKESGGFAIRNSKFPLIDAQTPVDENDVPHYNSLRQVSEQVGQYLQARTL